MIKMPLYSHNCYSSARISISRGSKWVAVLGVFVLAGIILRPWFQVSAKGVSPERIIGGIVRDDEGTVSGAIVRIEAVLLYRRAYKKLMDLKGWSEPDIVMESAAVSISQKQ
jgi:hypothetical protein